MNECLLLVFNDSSALYLNCFKFDSEFNKAWPNQAPNDHLFNNHKSIKAPTYQPFLKEHTTHKSTKHKTPNGQAFNNM